MPMARPLPSNFRLPNMGDRTNAKRQAAKREREAASGLKRKTITIPVAREAELEALIARWMKEKAEADQVQSPTPNPSER